MPHLLLVKPIVLLSLVRLSPGPVIFSTGFNPLFDSLGWDSGVPCVWLPEARLCRLLGLGLGYLRSFLERVSFCKGLGGLGFVVASIGEAPFQMFLATGGAEGFSGNGGIRAAYATAELLVPFACLGAFPAPIFSQFRIFGGTFQAFSGGKAFLSVLLCTGGAAKLSGYRWLLATFAGTICLSPFSVHADVGVGIGFAVEAPIGSSV